METGMPVKKKVCIRHSHPLRLLVSMFSPCALLHSRTNIPLPQGTRDDQLPMPLSARKAAFESLRNLLKAILFLLHNFPGRFTTKASEKKTGYTMKKTLRTWKKNSLRLWRECKHTQSHSQEKSQPYWDTEEEEWRKMRTISKQYSCSYSFLPDLYLIPETTLNTCGKD